MLAMAENAKRPSDTDGLLAFWLRGLAPDCIGDPVGRQRRPVFAAVFDGGAICTIRVGITTLAMTTEPESWNDRGVVTMTTPDRLAAEAVATAARMLMTTHVTPGTTLDGQSVTGKRQGARVTPTTSSPVT